jgi:hypothetical protein
MQLIFEEDSFLQTVNNELNGSIDRVYYTAALSLIEKLLGFMEENEDFISRIGNFSGLHHMNKKMKMLYMLVVYKKLIYLKETEGRQNTQNKVICYAIINKVIGKEGISICRQSLGLDVLMNDRYGNTGYYGPNKESFVEGMKDHTELINAINRDGSDIMTFADGVDEAERNTVQSLLTNFLS